MPDRHRPGYGLTALAAACAVLLVLAAVAPARAADEDDEDREFAVLAQAVEISRFLEVRFYDDWTRLRVEKIRGAGAPTLDTTSELIDFFSRHTSISLALRLRAGAFLEGYLSAGILRASLHDAFHSPSDAFPTGPEGKIEESVFAETGAVFALGAEVHLPLRTFLRAGFFYEIAYGEADVENEIFFLSPVEGFYRYFSHVFLLFADAPLEVEAPFEGVVRPRIGLGALVLRAAADLTSLDGMLDWDIDWTGKDGFLLRLSLDFEAKSGLYAFVRVDFVGRFGGLLGAGLKW